MIKPSIRLAKWGLITSGLFLSLAIAAVVWLFYSSATNPADSGESGILLLPFAMPWIMLLPENWLGLLSGIGCILLNGAIIYLVFGGLRFSVRKKDEQA